MTDRPYMNFGRRITAHRQLVGWSVSEAARQMNVQRTSLSRWEHGHEMPSGENIVKLHDHLRMPIGGDQPSYQLALPFDQPTNFELTVTRKTQDVVQLELRLKGLAS